MKKHGLSHIALSAVVALMLTGCVRSHTEWVKPGATANHLNSDRYVCLQSSTRDAPAVAGSEAQWGKNPNTHDREGYVSTYDMNTSLRNDLFNACMYAKGWQQITVQEQY